MSFKKKLQYAGSAPYKTERNRNDISPDEYEMLTEDETYQQLAEVRYLADELELNLDREEVPNEVVDELFSVIATSDAPLKIAVKQYVDHWLDEHREDNDA